MPPTAIATLAVGLGQFIAHLLRLLRVAGHYRLASGAAQLVPENVPVSNHIDQLLLPERAAPHERRAAEPPLGGGLLGRTINSTSQLLLVVQLALRLPPQLPRGLILLLTTTTSFSFSFSSSIAHQLERVRIELRAGRESVHLGEEITSFAPVHLLTTGRPICIAARLIMRLIFRVGRRRRRCCCACVACCGPDLAA